MKKVVKKEDGQSVDNLGSKPSGPVRKKVVTAKDLMKTVRDAQKLDLAKIVKRPRS